MGIGSLVVQRLFVYFCLVNQNWKRTEAVEHKSLLHNKLAIFRVDETATLKITNLLYDSYLRTTPK